MDKLLVQVEEPKDFFSGVGKDQLPLPTDILFFVRSTQNVLQQQALQNRSHHRFVLCLNIQTEGKVHVDQLVMPLKPRQALLIFPYQFHHYSQLRSTKLRWLFCTFEFQAPDFLAPLRNRILETSSETLGIMEEVLKEWHEPLTSLQAARLQVKVLQLLLSLKQDGCVDSTDFLPESEDNVVRTVNRLMAESKGRVVVVADLAESIGFSESRLRVLFKEAAGIPLGRYLQNYRLNRAVSLLRTSSLSIADVAEDAGFGSPQAFCRVFKKEIGTSPRTYRYTSLS